MSHKLFPHNWLINKAIFYEGQLLSKYNKQCNPILLKAAIQFSFNSFA